MELFRFIMNYLKKYRFMFIFGLLALLVVDVANSYIPKITGIITDGLAARSLDWGGIKHNLLLMFLLGLTLMVGRFLWRYLIFGASRRVERDLRNDIFAHLETLDAQYYHHHKTGDLMTRFTSDLNAVRMAIGPAVLCVFDAVLQTSVVLYQMIRYVNLKLTLISFIPMLTICFGYLYYGRILDRLYTARQDAVSDMTDFVQESFSGVRVIKAFVRERAQITEFAKANRLTMKRCLSIAKMQSFVVPLMDVIIGLSYLITLLYGGYLTLVGDITLGRFVAFNQYIHLLVWPMLACAEATYMFSQGIASLRRVKEVLDAESDVRVNADAKPAALTGEITLSHLTFSYKGTDRKRLHDLSLEIPAGTTLAVIGRTGSGKTTLVDLLMHLYNVEPGMITFDGIDINDITTKSLREQIAFVPQDNFLFSDTLRANIAFGVSSEDMDQITAATRAACIDDSIRSFPEGYDTVVGERGVTLSGGQKQRSSIARALLKDAPILIMDDSLSAVDTDTEGQILKNLQRLRAGKTTIMIAHRISTIRNADMILVLDKGRAVEVGSHAELLAKGGVYRTIFENQQLEEVQRKGGLL